MIEFLKQRLEQRKSVRMALQQQEQAKLERIAYIKSVIPLVKELLRDARYQKYTDLLKEAHRSFTAEREALLRGQDEDDPQTRQERISILTGRIMQLEVILTTPEQFLALAESGQANGSAASPPGA